ncbi:Probable hydroxyacylglutathione hydrolase C824.07 [Taphrina deformans PYCC 5710]|uniref:hydroxyacylglutathione hydrolase n=1 Tax=Taphrina deformans (strain PYCC 5710 / ATCC 11124 / CBS 356.35 / IMI 108563 / JCM 9778 / NBRC 8474) TaxID=1097556 RepID=R4X9G7_TAPDE|nr:Probable hydroxyacylglutathione hydrolase C824.07 [Taphrina deformans PYCC 5710]|eukprot:CCG82065.1 Probable hydroxyacylglutathione hydrolase C824.07 [Taphrina deformans PYCC 5710]
MHIQSIPMWKVASLTIVAYIIRDDKTKIAAVVDPAEPKSVLPVLEKAIKAGDIDLKYLITTHHHADHAGGNKEILSHYPDLKVIAGKDCACVQTTPADGEVFQVGELSIKSIHTPCHTQDSICFYAEQDGSKAVFTGDTLFIAGCGRFFEGTAEEMNTALNKKLSKLPSDTLVYPGHEYTAANAKFATKVLPDSAELKKFVKFCETGEETCGKFTIKDELSYNPFMRLSDPAILKATGADGDVGVMAKLREMKNNS